MTTPAVDPTLQVDTPDFSLDEHDQNLELWTFRLPVNVPLSALKDLELDLQSNSATFSANDQTFEIRLGDPEETSSFRVLVPHTESETTGKDIKTNNYFDDEEDDDDDDDEKDEEEKEQEREAKKLFNLKASRKEFSRHFTVTARVPTMTETQMAPLVGPPAVDPMRIAYTPVPQRTGLKRRWMPLGVPKQFLEETNSTKKRSLASEEQTDASPSKGASTSTASKRIKRESIGGTTNNNNSDSDGGDSTSENQTLTKSERKARKAEKKAAKKAKKEAKKAKKEAKKAKKAKIKNES